MEKNLSVWFVTPQKKMRPKEYNPFGTRESYNIYVARNATEGCQMAILSKSGNRKNMSLEVVNDSDAGFEVELLRERYVSCDGALFPDPVVPDDTNFELEEWKNTTFLINVKTTKDTVPGGYGFKVILRENGEIYGEYPIWVTVWNFEIDDNQLMETAFGLEQKFIDKVHNTENDTEMYKKYYDFLLDRYHICATWLPYDILDDRADAYMSDPRVKSFRIPYEANPEQITAYYNKLKSNPIWLKKAYYYVVDEPQNLAAYDRIKETYELIEKYHPNHETVVPFYMDPADAPDKRAIDLLQPYCKVWCPKISLFKDDYMGEFMLDRQSKGDRTWWYYCWEPPLPYSNVFIDMEGFYHRTIAWQQYLYGINGMLYWATNWWKHDSPWKVTTTIPELSNYCFGDGSLLYNGNEIGIDGPVGSIRLEILRYSIEDHYMFKLAEKAFGRDYIVGEINKITSSVYRYTDVHWMLDEVRREIGDKLSEYYANK